MGATENPVHPVILSKNENKTMRSVTLCVQAGEGGTRLDRFLADHLAKFSRSALKRMIDDGHVTLNGETLTPHHKTREGEQFCVITPPAEPLEVEPEDIPLDVIYEDSDIVVINKRAGMVVHPAKGHYSGTLVNALLFHCKDLSGIGGKIRPGIVHRLDKETSGLIAVAKNDSAHKGLSAQLKTRTMGREYLAILRGVLKDSSGTIDIPIGRHPVYRKKISVRTGKPREAITKYETIETFENASYVRAKLRTGRTHQIRVHFSAIGHPIIGDTVYGKGKSKLIKRTALHAERLTLKHPATGEVKIFSAEPPEDFLKLLSALRKEKA